MEVDDLLPMVEAATLLAFARSESGDVEITAEGKAFAEADIAARKSLFREAALANVTLLQQMDAALVKKSDHAMPLEFFRDILREHFSDEEAGRQLDTALELGPVWRPLHLRFRQRPAPRARCGRGARHGSAHLMTSRSPRTLIPLPAWNRAKAASLLTDLPMALAGLALFYSLLALAHYWAAPVESQAHIDLSPTALPLYALFSVGRIAVAYFCSLLFAVVYGYIAAHNARAERLMIPLLDTLQSIPVLCFLPGIMLAMVALFPTAQLGLELGSILLIFTGQVWNMAFSFYSSLKNIPREMLEAAQIYRLSWWQKLMQLELPYAAIGLIWNSMMSVAGGWFALMVCEMFVLGNRDLRLPGLGSYLQTASNAGEMRSIVWGLAVMIAVIVLIDQLVWRPLIAWSEKFKFEQVEASESAQSPMLAFLRRSRLLARAARVSIAPAGEALTLHFARAQQNSRPVSAAGRPRAWAGHVVPVVVAAGILYAIGRMGAMVTTISRTELHDIFLGAGATFLRVELTLALAGSVDYPRRSLHRIESEALRHRPAARADCRFRPRPGTVPPGAAAPHPHRRRIGNRFHHSAAARHAMVRAVQRDCRRHRHARGPEGSLRRFSSQPRPALAEIAVARHLSVPDYRPGYGFGRCLERQYHRRVFPLSRPDLFHHRPRRGHQPRHR